MLEKGFVRISRKWEGGDTIDINLPLFIRRVLSHKNVVENTGKVAFERGPLVYCAEWVQYDFSKPTTVSSVKVYWFDDTGQGECRIPESWQVLYRAGHSWKPVAITEP